nr:hypothetical protein Iba_chr03bCG15910 [Ipomoea batatas]
MSRSAREGGQQHPHHLTSTFVLSSEGLIHGTKNHDVEMAKPQLHCKSHKCTKIALSFLALPHPSHLFQTAASQLYEHCDISHPTHQCVSPFFPPSLPFLIYQLPQSSLFLLKCPNPTQLENPHLKNHYCHQRHSSQKQNRPCVPQGQKLHSD